MGRRKRYSAEFKREALRRAKEPGVTDVLVAEELGIDARQLRRWRDAEKQNVLSVTKEVSSGRSSNEPNGIIRRPTGRAKTARRVAMNKTSLGSMLLALAIMLIPVGVTLAAEKQLKIAMVQWTGDTRACIGFRDGLKELGYAVEYTMLNAEQDRTKLGHILRGTLRPRLKEFAYVYTYGTTVTKATKQVLNNQAPQIFAIVLDPVGAGIVPSLESSGANITGATNGVSLALQLDTALTIAKFKTLGFLFNSREKNSMLIREQLRELAASRQIEIIDLRSPPAMDSLKENLRKLNDKSIIVDAVYIPSDSFMRTNAELIGSELRAAKVRSFGATKEYVDGGVLLGLVPDYYKLGKAAAGIVDRHEKGEKLQNIPVATDEEPTLLINKATARLLNVTIPEELFAKATFVE